MTTTIYAWPPILARGVEHTIVQPYSESTSALGSETRYVSSYSKERKVVTLVISGRNNQGSAGGYINMLKRYLKGGQNLVRLSSQPSHFNLDWLGTRGQQQEEVTWTHGPSSINWTYFGNDITWAEDTPLFGTAYTENGFNGVSVTGFEPNTIVAYPDELIKVYYDNSTQEARVIKLTTSDAEGVARIRVDAPLSTGRILIGYSDSSVFKLTEIPRTVQYAGEDFEYTFELREVFLDEIVGGYEEIDPWR